MKNNHLILNVIAVSLLGVALTGCSTQQTSTNASETNSIPKVAKSTKMKNSENSSATKVSAKEKIKTTAVAEKPATQVDTNTSAKTTVNSNSNSSRTVTTTTTRQPNENTSAADQLLKVKLVDAGMDYIAKSTNQEVMPNGYWAFAKESWGISDAQVLTSIGGNSYQVFSQGQQRYILTVGTEVSTLKAYSTTDNNSTLIKIANSSAAIISID